MKNTNEKGTMKLKKGEGCGVRKGEEILKLVKKRRVECNKENWNSVGFNGINNLFLITEKRGQGLGDY